MTNAILMTSVLLMLKRWQPPFGSVTVLFTVSAVMVAALAAFELPLLIVPAVVGGLAGDVLIARLRPALDRPGAFRAVGVLVPLPLWTAYYAALALTDGLAWTQELYSGMVVYNALAGLVLAQVMLPVGRRSTAAV